MLTSMQDGFEVELYPQSLKRVLKLKAVKRKMIDCLALYFSISWISMALLGSLASSAGDTLASELGSVYSKSDPWLITSFSKVPKGSNSFLTLQCSKRTQISSVSCPIKVKPVFVFVLLNVSGTNGGISIIGTLFSIIGGLIVGIAFYCTLLLCSTAYQLETSPPQWPIVVVGGIAGESPGQPIML